MSKPILRFIRRGLTLDLNDQAATFLHQDFTPPAESTVPLIAEGTSANRRGGGTLAGTRAVDRNLTFTVNVRAGSGAAVGTTVNRIQAAVALAGDEADRLYLEWAENSGVGPRPLWGQGPWRRYEVIYGSVALAPSYLTGARKNTDVDVTLSLVVRPHAYGLQQRLASATGGVLLDNLGTVDGRDRGVIVPEATTNKMTNPVFGSATYNTGWTADASLVVSQNTDPAYLLPGTRNSAKLVSSAANQEFYQSINAGNTNTHYFQALIMLPDFGTPSSADMVLFYNAALTTTFTDLGNGLWRASATAAGINAATNTGVQVKSGRAIYLLAYQMEEKAYLTPVAWGDLLGCAWTGTAHASTSTRTAGRIRVAVAADTFSTAQGAVVLAWKAPYANTHANDLHLFSSDAFFARFESTDDKIYFSDNTNTISSDAQTFAEGDVLWFAFVWGPSGLAVYKNGASLVTGATYTPPAAQTYVYVGSSNTPATQGYGPFMDFRIYGEELTAAEVLADYNNRAEVTDDGQRAGSIPWLWTKDGDDVVDNVDDSTRDNFCVVAGVPGSAPADTEYYFEIEPDSGTTNAFTLDEAYHLSLLANDYFYPPSSIEVLANNDGTATTAADLGSDVETISVNTTAVSPATADQITIDRPDLLYGRQLYVLARLSDAGANLRLRVLLKFGASVFSEYVSVTADATRRAFILGPLSFPGKQGIFGDSASTKQMTVTVQMLRSVAGAANVTIDYTQLLFAPVVRVKAPSSTTALTGINSRLRGKQATIESGAAFQDIAEVTGEPIDLRPDQFNTVFMLRGNHGAAHTIGNDMIFEVVKVTPRYALL